MPKTYHESVKLLLGSLWQTTDWFRCNELSINLTQSLQHILQFILEGCGFAQ